MIQAFLIKCSGANEKILKRCPEEKSKYAGIGAAILLTAMFAVLSGIFFVNFAFTDQKTGETTIKTWQMIFVGVLWGLLIFTIDRNLIMSMKKSGNRKEEVRQGWLRIWLSVLIGIVISMPLELKIFEKEITEQIFDNNTKTIKSRTDEQYNQESKFIKIIDSSIKKSTEDKKIITNRYNELYLEMKGEAEGTHGTFKKGRGPAFDEKQAEFNRTKTQDSLMADRIKVLVHQKDSVLKKIEKGIEEATKNAEGGNGVGKRILALYQTSWVHWFITLLFIFIELLPVGTKILSQRGAYDIALETLNYKRKQISDASKKKIDEDMKNKIEVDAFISLRRKENYENVELAILDEELNRNKEIITDISQKQSDFAKKAIQDWYDNQIKSSGIHAAGTSPSATVKLENKTWKLSNSQTEVFYVFQNGKSAKNNFYRLSNGQSESGYWELDKNNSQEITIELNSSREVFTIIHLAADKMELQNMNTQLNFYIP
jgi:hypothetical protein